MKQKQLFALLLAGTLVLSGSVNAYAAPAGSPPGGMGNAPESFGGAPGGSGGGSSSSSAVYDAATTISSADTQSGKSYSSTEADKIALLVSTSDAVSLNNITVTKSGDSDGGENCNFFGQNAAVLVKDGSATTITGGTVTSSASGANGVFCYGGNGGSNGTPGDGTTVNISDVTITTTGSGSGGIMTTGGGVTNATNLTITTSGGSSAPIRTDRGGGTVNVTGGTYTSNGLGSPAIYSTADITVSRASLVSNLSEGVCIEGKNTITLNDCSLTANNTKTNGNATYLDSIMIYQSNSGDSSTGTSVFTMNGGTLTSKSGHVFHVTNTAGVINLDGVAITNSDSDQILLSVANDGWSGSSNQAAVNASSQTLEGAIIVSNASSTVSSGKSSLALNLTNASTYTGAISDGSTGSNTGTVDVTLDSTSLWVMDSNSYVTSLSGAGKINYNGYTLYVNGTAYTADNPYSGAASTTETSVSSSGSGSSDAAGSSGSGSSDTAGSADSASGTEDSSVDPVTDVDASETTASSGSTTSVPATVRLKSAKNTRKKTAKITWKKNSSVSGYQIRYAVKKTMKNASKKKVSGASKTSTLLKNLTKGKTYWVQVRTYKKVGSKTVYSSWSNKKKVKITK